MPHISNFNAVVIAIECEELNSNNDDIDNMISACEILGINKVKDLLNTVKNQIASTTVAIKEIIDPLVDEKTLERIRNEYHDD